MIITDFSGDQIVVCDRDDGLTHVGVESPSAGTDMAVWLNQDQLQELIVALQAKVVS